MITPYLAMVLAGFSAFALTLAGVSSYQWVSDAKAKRSAGRG